MKSNLCMTLKNGRKLGYAEFGASSGKTLFFFHGLPGSRLDASWLHDAALKTDIRLIGIDRPGIGLSTQDKTRSILSFADDIDEFAKALELDTFSILGHSGGAPYIAACAYKISHRLNSAAIVSGMAPFELPEAKAYLNKNQRFINKLIKSFPISATLLAKLMSLMLKKPERLDTMVQQLPIADQIAFKSLGSYGVMAEKMKEAFKQGVGGVSLEMQLTVQPWGVDCAKIECPVTIWQGALDKQAPVRHAEIYARIIPGSKLTLFKDEGHLSILINKGEDILRHVSIGGLE